MDLGSLVGSMTMGNLIGGIIFSGVGFVAFMYGKKEGHFKLMLVGGVLMAYPMFVSNTALLYLIGAGLTAVAWTVRD